jgi:hypothetical protein
MASIVALSEQSKLLSDREPNARMDFSGSRAEVEKLLKYFLVGTQNVTLENQILDIDKIPEPCRARVRAVEAQGLAWGAWSSERGPMVAWATYDGEASARLRLHQLYIEWFVPPKEFHALWCRCSPKHPAEWIVGRRS